jgi:hypothetical protein
VAAVVVLTVHKQAQLADLVEAEPMAGREHLEHQIKDMLEGTQPQMEMVEAGVLARLA